MNRFHAASAIAAIAALACACSAFSHRPEDDAKHFGAAREFEFDYTARVKDLPSGAKRVDLWIPIPRSQPFQDVTLSDRSGPVAPEIVDEPTYGNRYAHYALEGQDVKPFEVTMKWVVTRKERVHDEHGSSLTDPPTPQDRGADRLVPTTGEIATRAREAVGDATTDLQKGERIYRYVLDHMRYSKEGTGWGNGDVSWACREGYGNCSDFHALFIAMARSQGIPARFTMGFPLPPERGDKKIPGYHCWAEFFVPGIGWVPVDASEADKHPELADYYFGSLTADRVELSRGRDLELAPPQHGAALNFFIYPYAEVDGQPFAGVEKEFEVKDRG